MSVVSDMVRIRTCVRIKSNVIPHYKAVQSDFDICCTHVTDYLSHDAILPNTAALTNCTVIRRQSFCCADMFSDWSLHQTVRCTYATRAEQRSPITYERDNKKCWCGPTNLIRLRRRFPVTWSYETRCRTDSYIRI